MGYLLKVTIIWIFLLILFELLYKNKRRYTANRIILVMSLAFGLLLPFVPKPVRVPISVEAKHSFYSAKPLIKTEIKNAVQAPLGKAQTGVIDNSIRLWPLIYIIYGLGVFLLFAHSLFELYKIKMLIRRKPVQMVYGKKVIETGKPHAPYSFMGYVFIDSISAYTPHDLAYIIMHEAAHFERKHCLDLWTVQLFCIVFWFHPLIWRYKYQLRLQQEFEADDIAAAGDAYNYGHFLIRQTLLAGVPSIAHSFHFSPIKNRIAMLTKKRNLTSSGWKYFLLAPVLLGCTFITAKEPGEGSPSNVTSYKGNIFKWGETDTLYYDKQSKKAVLADNILKKQIIIGLNNEPVYRNELLSTPASYGDSESAYSDYVINEFQKRTKNTADSTSSVSISNLVINKEGKVVNYQMHYWHKSEIAGAVSSQDWNLFHDLEPRLDSIVEKIISEGPKWKPGMLDGKPVNTLVSFFWGC